MSANAKVATAKAAKAPAAKASAAKKTAVTTTGRCQCRAIEYQFSGEPKWVMHCHCESCRRAVSSAVATYVGVRLEQFSYLQGEPTVYESSPGVKRYFCAKCGSPMAYAGARWPGEVHLFHGTLAGPRAMAADRPRPRQGAGVLVRGQRSPAALRRHRRQGRQARAQGPEALMVGSDPSPLRSCHSRAFARGV